MQRKIPLWTDATWSCQCRVLVSTTLLETRGRSYLMKWSKGYTYVALLMIAQSPPSTLLTCELSMETSLFLRLAISCSVWSFCFWQSFRWFSKAMFLWVRFILFTSEFFNSSSNSWTRDSSSSLSVASFIFPSSSSSTSSSALGGKLSSLWAKVKERVQQINCYLPFTSYTVNEAYENASFGCYNMNSNYWGQIQFSETLYLWLHASM